MKKDFHWSDYGYHFCTIENLFKGNCRLQKLKLFWKLRNSASGDLGIMSELWANYGRIMGELWAGFPALTTVGLPPLLLSNVQLSKLSNYWQVRCTVMSNFLLSSEFRILKVCLDIRVLQVQQPISWNARINSISS